jgi:5-methylthioadenosine/S-adenosylhomocysteine deaminase
MLRLNLPTSDHGALPPRVLVRGGLCLGERGEAQRVSILIGGDTIEALIPQVSNLPDDCQVIEAEDFAIIPGLVNAHTHGHGGLSKGSGDRWTLELLLNAGGWLGGNRSDDDRYVSTLLAAVEMLQKGCTACFDLSVAVPLPTADGMAAAAQAYLDAGMRAVVAPMVGDIHFYRALPGLLDAADAGMRKDMERAAGTAGVSMLPTLEQIASKWPFSSDQVRLGMAPTIPLHSTDEFMVGCHHIARKHGLALQTHLAESKTQAIASRSRFGRSITSHLVELGVIDDKFSGAHGVWLDDDDMQSLGERGAAVAHNPGSNLRLGSGIADVCAMLAKGITVGVGTDGGASADGQNMFEATRLCCNLSRVKGPTADQWLDAIASHRLSTAGGAKVLGMQDQIGKIAPGYKADLVFLSLDHVNYVPLNNLVHQLVHVEDGAAVRHVMVGGRIVVQDRNILTVNVDALRQKSAAAAERLRSANAEIRAVAERLAPFIGRFCAGLSCRCATSATRGIS